MSLLEPKTKKGEIARLVLAIIGVAGILVIGAVAPNIFQLFPRKYRSRFSKKSVDQSIEKMKRQGLLKLVAGKRGSRLELTDLGRTELLAYETRQKILKPVKRWDKKWRLLIFDIKESRKGVREQVRTTLINLGFHRLQDSVWVYPHECEEVLELLRTKYGIRYEALYLRAEKVTNDRWLRQDFVLN